MPDRGWPERGWMDLALAAYADPLARGRTVLFVGDPQSPAAIRLGEAAARLEVVPTGGRQRPSRSGRGTLRSHAEAGEWDLVWLSDAAAVVADAAQLREVAEALSERGVAILAVDAEEAVYEALYRDLRAQFEHVRMLGQAPFAGQSIVDFAGAQRDAGLSFDDSIVGDDGVRPARYIGLCGPRQVSLDAHTIVQVPADAGSGSGEARRDLDAARARLEHSERRLEQAQREIARSGQKLDELRHELARVQGELGRADERAAAQTGRAAELAARVETAEASLRAAEEALTRSAANEDAESEVAELERSLHQRAREIVELRAEVERRGVIVRDALEAAASGVPPLPAPLPPHTAEPSSPAPASGAPGLPIAPDVPAELVALREALVAAQRRAVDAEAARAAATFARDEAGREAEKLRQAHVAEVAVHARDAGRARGLLSRVAELEEMRMLLEARLELAQSDLREAGTRLKEAQRETGLVREQYEMAVARGRAMEHAAQARPHGETPSGMIGMADAVTAALNDAGARADAAVAQVDAQLTVSEAARARADEEIARLRTSLELLEAEAARAKTDASAREAALEATLASERAAMEGRIEALGRDGESRVEGLRGEITGLRLLVADLEAARAAQAAAPAPVAMRSSSGELAATRDRLDLVSEAHRANLDLQQMTAARADAEAARALELAQRVLALDALVSRLQSSLAQEAERAASARRALRTVEARLAEAVEARDALEAVQVVRLEEERRVTTELTERAETSERSLRAVREVGELFRLALTETRSLLADASARLPAAAAEPRGTSAGDGVLRERLDEMRVAIEDRDVLLRSLTAQLQDKDDRIRGLETTMRGGARAGGGTDALEAAIAEREERIGRLRAELEEARATQARIEGASGGAKEREAELRRLQGGIADRDAQLMALEGRAIAAERDQKEMRDTFAAARVQLEGLLGDTRVKGGTAGELGDHIGELLRLLRRF